MSTGAVMGATEGKRNDALARPHGGAWLLALSSVALPSERVLQRRFEPLMFID